VLDLLQERLAAAEDVTSVDRDRAMLVVRSRDVPTWAYVVSVLLGHLRIRSVLMRARTDRVLRITAIDHGQDDSLELDGDANASVSRILFATSHELFPEKIAAWDNE